MMRRSGRAAFLFALVAVVLVQVGSLSMAEQRRPGTKKVPQIGAVLPGDDGRGFPTTIVYDNNIPASRDGSLNVPIGNIFGNSPPINTFSIQGVTFKLAGCYPSPYIGARAFIYDIDPTAMTAMQVAAFSAGAGPGVNCNAANFYSGMLPAPIMNQVLPFFGGILNTPFAPCAGNTMVGGTCEGVALTMGTMDPGLGFHAARINGNMYTAIAPVKNAIFRVYGEIVPVELMGFSVE